jgi:hypothetical protein
MVFFTSNLFGASYVKDTAAVEAAGSGAWEVG